MLNPVPTKRGAVAALSVCALVVGLQSGAGASPAQQARDPLTPRIHFAMKADGSSGAKKVGAAIPNIDSVKATIRTYYAANSDGIADKTKSPYITEINKILTDQTTYLAQHAHDTPKQAIVLDTDDTTLWTYDMEDGAMNFNFDPKLQDTWVQRQLFPATPGMVDFVDKAAKPWATPSSASPDATTTRRARRWPTSPRSATPTSPRTSSSPSGPASAPASSRPTSPARR